MTTSNLIKSINRCLIPKLSENYREGTEYLEFDARNKNLATNIKVLVRNLHDLKKIDLQKDFRAVALLLYLFYELRCDGQWNDWSTKHVSELLDAQFFEITSIHLDSICSKNFVFKSQDVFEILFDDLHFKLSFEEYKKYPVQIEVYCLLTQKVQEFSVAVEPYKIFPLSLVLIEDNEIFYKKKGLLCCINLLQCLAPSDFENGNYYDVIYRVLEKNLSVKDVDITNLTHSNLLKLFYLLPNSGKGDVLEGVYKTCLNLLLTETNLYQKAIMFNFINSIILHHKYNCGNKSIFKDIVYQNLDICINHEAMEIILDPLIKCLKRWIIYCWPMWKFGAHRKILSAFFKVLYVCNNEYLDDEIHNIIVIIISLATKDEQREILSNLHTIHEIHCPAFKQKITDIKLALH